MSNKKEMINDNSWHLPQLLKTQLYELMKSVMIVGIVCMLILITMLLSLRGMFINDVVANNNVLIGLFILSLITSILAIREMEKQLYYFNKMYLKSKSRILYDMYYAKQENQKGVN